MCFEFLATESVGGRRHDTPVIEQIIPADRAGGTRKPNSTLAAFLSLRTTDLPRSILVRCVAWKVCPSALQRVQVW